MAKLPQIIELSVSLIILYLLIDKYKSISHEKFHGDFKVYYKIVGEEVKP
jgi:hypothetical protein